MITRHFCTMMGGDIRVRSEPGKGSIFTIRLPAEIDDQAAHPAPVDTATDAKATVLVIDDDRSLHEFLGAALAAEGYHVLHALGGDEGLRLARDARPDVITLDIIMPGRDGWSVLADLKNDADLGNIPVILLTVVGDSDLAYALGATDYLTKPVDVETLVRSMERHCDPGQRRILVVDDDEATHHMLRRVLQGKGWAVSEAAGGKEALDKIAANPPALVLLDLMMPGMDGFEVMEALRAEEAWRHLPVIVITAKDLSREETARLEGRVETVLRKGAYDRRELLELVRRRVGESVGRQ